MRQTLIQRSLLIFFCLSFSSAKTIADENPRYTCPNTIGYIQQNAEVSELLPMIKSIYARLGCDTEFKSFPGRRGVVEFNSGSIDGEFARVPAIEEEYKRTFVKSEVPIISHIGYLWIREKTKQPFRQLTGYTMGVKWQEDLMKGKPDTRKLVSNADKFKAYSDRLIDKFLETDHMVELAVQDGLLDKYPEHKQEIGHLNAFHYLAKEYADFINAFNAQLKKESGLTKKIAYHDVR